MRSGLPPPPSGFSDKVGKKRRPASILPPRGSGRKPKRKKGYTGSGLVARGAWSPVTVALTNQMGNSRSFVGWGDQEGSGERDWREGGTPAPSIICCGAGCPGRGVSAQPSPTRPRPGPAQSAREGHECPSEAFCVPGAGRVPFRQWRRQGRTWKTPTQLPGPLGGAGRRVLESPLAFPSGPGAQLPSAVSNHANALWRADLKPFLAVWP